MYCKGFFVFFLAALDGMEKARISKDERYEKLASDIEEQWVSVF